MFARKRKAQFIDAKSYPPLMRAVDAAPFAALLRSDTAVKRANRAMLARVNQLRDVVLEYVSALERAAQAGDVPEIFAQAHEIRGFAEMVGLVAAGRIANKLCHYLDTSARRNQTPDRMVITLHVDAISRAARAKDEATRLGDEVVNELAALASYKLAGAVDVAAE
ncbi:MAG TPA: Hpt domain-containing protein [Rhizomicrobium sp.]|jgi:HPt (histidine-containing phosphotransfer) domain-containing protein